MKKLGIIDWLALILVIIGGIDWGMIGMFKYDLILKLFGELSVQARIAYIFVGLAAAYLALTLPKYNKKH